MKPITCDEYDSVVGEWKQWQSYPYHLLARFYQVLVRKSQ